MSDALIVAMDMLNKKTMKKRYQRRIFLVTDAGSPVNQSDWDIIVNYFKKMEAHLNVIGINFADEEGSNLLSFTFPLSIVHIKGHLWSFVQATGGGGFV